MFEMAVLTKMLAKSGIDLKAIMEDSARIPKLLEILARQSNAQTQILNSIQEKIDSYDLHLARITARLDKIEKKLEEKP